MVFKYYGFQPRVIFAPQGPFDTVEDNFGGHNFVCAHRHYYHLVVEARDATKVLQRIKQFPMSPITKNNLAQSVNCAEAEKLCSNLLAKGNELKFADF